MTVSTITFFTDWSPANGANKNWSYDFQIPDGASVRVQVRTGTDDNTIVEYTDDFELFPNGDGDSGYVVYPSAGAALAAGFQVRIKREISITQTTEIGDEGDFRPEIHERAFDKLTMLAQQINGATAGSLVVQGNNPGYLVSSSLINNTVLILKDELVQSGPSLAEVAAVPGYAAQAKVYRDEAEGFKNTAEAAKNTAITKANEANNSAIAALASENAAGLSETAAEIAQGLAEDARDIAVSASVTATDAADAASLDAASALGSKNAAALSESNAADSETAAGISAGTASTKATEATTARDFAWKWATEAQGTPVDDGTHSGYSAYHWAQVAAGFAGNAVIAIPAGQPLPSVNYGPIYHEDYADVLTWQVFDQNGADYEGYASTRIGELVSDIRTTPRKGTLALDGATYIVDDFLPLFHQLKHVGLMLTSAWVWGDMTFIDMEDGTFRVPDVRGVFLRPWIGSSTAWGPQTVRPWGVLELDAIKTHNHPGTGLTFTGTPHSHTVPAWAGDTPSGLGRAGPSSVGSYSTSSVTAGGTIGGNTGNNADGIGETRPVNTSILATIKF